MKKKLTEEYLLSIGYEKAVEAGNIIMQKGNVRLYQFIEEPHWLIQLDGFDLDLVHSSSRIETQDDLKRAIEERNKN